jgi:uncharacterized alpha-E superfamily protein
MASALAVFGDPAAPDGALDVCIEIGDSAMTHRSRYAVSTSRKTVVDLLGLDAQNPRSILYHLTEMRDHAMHLSETLSQGGMSDLSRALLRTFADLAARTPETLDTAALAKIRDEIAALSDILSSSYLK